MHPDVTGGVKQDGWPGFDNSCPECDNANKMGLYFKLMTAKL